MLGNAVACGDLGGPEQNRLLQPLADVEHPDLAGVIADELQQVSVSADHDHRVAALGAGQRAQHVISLESLGAGGCDTERVEHLEDRIHLGAQIVGNLLDVLLAWLADRTTFLGHPVCLVGRDEIDPELRSPVQVETYHQPPGLILGDQRGDAVEEAAHCVDRPTIRRGD